MGSGNSGLFKGTSGSVRLPKNDSQLKHIFRKKRGHLLDTNQNRKKLYMLAQDEKNYMNTDARGHRWYAEYTKDGGQFWVEVRNGIIKDGGYNITPKPWDPITGFNKNPWS